MVQISDRSGTVRDFPDTADTHPRLNPRGPHLGDGLRTLKALLMHGGELDYSAVTEAHPWPLQRRQKPGAPNGTLESVEPRLELFGGGR